MTDPPSLPHLAAIDAVLRALPPDLSVPRAILVLEDASVALLIGGRLGLTLAQIVTQHAEILGEERTAQFGEAKD